MQGNATLVALAALLAAQLFVFLLVVRLRQVVASAGGTGEADAAVSVDGDTVACPECGATNEVGYRFCAECVCELPGSASHRMRSSVPFSRSIR